MAAIVDGAMHASTATASPEILVKIAEHYSAGLPQRAASLRPRPPGTKDTILVTGTTGNFGCDLLDNLLRDSSVELVYAVNRRGSHPLERQKAAFRERDFDETLLESPKFKMVEGDISAPGLGIEPGLLDEIRNSVTCMIHNAWRVNFNLPVSSFEVYLSALQHLINIALSSPFSEAPKIQFISSVTVFENCVELLPPIPEDPIDPMSALGSGYGESKWIGERMLLNVTEQTGVPVQIVRLAQICGGHDGYWNEDEWFPTMVKSAFVTNCLPDIDGVAAFIPNYPAARALIEMRSSPSTILHLVHPRPARLRTLLAITAKELAIPLVSWDAWLDALARSAKSVAAGRSQSEFLQAIRRNPALILLGFFCTRKFTQANEACPFLALSTDKARMASDTLEHLPELDDDVAIRWLSAWRGAGYFEKC